MDLFGIKKRRLKRQEEEQKVWRDNDIKNSRYKEIVRLALVDAAYSAYHNDYPFKSISREIYDLNYNLERKRMKILGLIPAG